MNTPLNNSISNTQIHTLVGVSIVGVLWLLYQQSFAFDYVYFDDDDYVLNSPMVLAGLSFEGLQWAITSFEVSNWHPLTWLSHMLDVTLFGPTPAAAHIHNTLLHGVNSLLVYALLLRFVSSLWQSALLAMIFLVHPLHVESVAWIAERKDLLCGVFYLATLLFYDSYRRHGGAGYYLGTFACLLLALMAKPMAVSLPVIMVLLDITVYREHWQQGNSTPLPRLLWRIGSEKAPFIIVTAGACLLTVLAQDGAQAVAHLDAHSLTDRLETASSAYLIYLKQWVVPVNLIAYYPMKLNGGTIAWVFPTLAVLVVCVVALLLARRAPLIALGWGWYMVSLLPVIGLVQVGSQAHADRYMYLPSVGLLVAASALFPPNHSRYLRSSYLVAVVFTAYLGVLCYWQVGTWKNQYTLFSRVMELAGPNHKAYVHLTDYHIRTGSLDEAQRLAELGIALTPARSDGYQALGNIALARQDFSAAETHYRAAIARGPIVGAVLNNLGITLAQQGKHAEAVLAFNEALRVQPNLQAARQNLKRQIDSRATD